MRNIKLEDCDIELTVEIDEMPVRGNALASGNDAEDKAQEEEIIRRLSDGDVWAWCCVDVRVTHRESGITGVDFLGCCSYRDEADFKTGSYYDDMVNKALEYVRAEAERIFKALE